MTRRIERAKALLRRGDLLGDRRVHERRLHLTGLVQRPVHRAGRGDRRAPTGPVTTPWPPPSQPASTGCGAARCAEQDGGATRAVAAPSVAAMDLHVSHCFLTVHDQDAALAFYRDALGLTVHTDVAIGGDALADPHDRVAARARDRPDGAARWPGSRGRGRPPRAGRQGLLDGLIFDTSDVDGTSSGSGPRGPRCCRSRSTSPTGCGTAPSGDPSGNMIRLSQAKG